MDKKKFPFFVQPNEPAEDCLLETLLSDFPSDMNLSEQMAIFSDRASLTNADFRERVEIATLINRRLRFYFPTCDTLLYGSTVNGLGFKGCDLDLLFLSHPEYSNTSDDPEEKVSLKVTYKHVKLGNVSKPMLRKLDETSLLQFIKVELYRVPKVKNVIYIPAKHPILNFNAGKSSITCDLSASNRLVFYNSALLNLLLRIDHRVKLLAMSLRFWAKKLKFIKKGGFTSYAFTLMIIFFLQNAQPPILPSVKQLSDLSGYSRKIDGWECSFTEDLDSIQFHSENEESPDVLLLKFFAFYWQLDFTRNVISPYMGRTIPLKDLLNSDDERLKQFKASPVCIQDPFILSKNVTANVNHSAAHSFKKSIVDAYNMLQKAGNKLQLTQFFNMERFEYSKDSSDGNYVIVMHPNLDDFKFLENEYQWYAEVAWGIHKVLDFVLLFECEVIDMNYALPNSSPQQNVTSKEFNTDAKKDSEDVPMMLDGHEMFSEMFSKNIEVELELLLSIQCTAYFRTWFHRKHVSEAMQSEANEELNDKNGSKTMRSESDKELNDKNASEAMQSEANDELNIKNINEAMQSEANEELNDKNGSKTMGSESDKELNDKNLSEAMQSEANKELNMKNINEAMLSEANEELNTKNINEAMLSEANEELNPVLRQERCISDVILAKSPLLMCPEPMFWFCCDIYKYNKKELTNIIVRLVPLQPSKEISVVFTFLRSFLPKTVRRYLRSMKQSAES